MSPTAVPRSRPSTQSRMRGFTLVEILVAITLLGLIAVALGAALRGMVQTESKVADRLTRIDDFRTSTALVKSIAGRVWAQKRTSVQNQGQGAFAFQGTPEGMAWIGVMPPRYGAGGRYFFRLALEQTGEGASLVLRFSPWRDIPGFPDWSQADARVLAQNITDFSITYEDDMTEPRQWGRSWPVADRLPGHVNLQIATAQAAWPNIVVPLRQFGGATLGGGAVIGGSSS